MVSSAINGGKIDFNKDGFADIVQIGTIVESIGYSSKVSMLIASDQAGFFKVALGSPTGISFLTTGSTANGAKVATDGIGDQIAVVDLNGDGYQDILAIKAATIGNLGSITRRYIYDPMANKFGAPQIGDPVATNLPHLGGNSGQMTLGDVNSDSIPDLVFSRYDINNPVTNPNPSVTDQVIPHQVLEIVEKGPRDRQFDVGANLAAMRLQRGHAGMVRAHGLGRASEEGDGGHVTAQFGHSKLDLRG